MSCNDGHIIIKYDKMIIVSIRVSCLVGLQQAADGPARGTQRGVEHVHILFLAVAQLLDATPAEYFKKSTLRTTYIGKLLKISTKKKIFQHN